ncbi:aldose 1-epimerase [Sphingobium subterraneum]|uniref:Aldose 1-epimerase n=2 Tax=Sphingobium subterraneum TaxID=627688 RepID=A0A841IZU8_9SPHN|nr:aldose 1-epimerase [Sphingobium subterraneum]
MTVLPEWGGSIGRLKYRRDDETFPLLRPAPDDAQHALACGCFPLVPFSNRIRGGTFVWQDRRIFLAPNMKGDPSPLHGQGWLVPWRVDSSGADRAILTYHHVADEWPWDYAARIDYHLHADRLVATLSCRNLSPDPMPCGLGFHPYFLCDATTRLETDVGHVWTVDEDVLPVERIPATGRFSLDGPVCGRDLDNGYDGWSGTARICEPGRPFDLILSSPAVPYFQLYSPPGGGIFVAEPVTHANDALSRPDGERAMLGIRALGAGEEMTLSMDLIVETKTR